MTCEGQQQKTRAICPGFHILPTSKSLAVFHADFRTVSLKTQRVLRMINKSAVYNCCRFRPRVLNSF